MHKAIAVLIGFYSCLSVGQSVNEQYGVWQPAKDLLNQGYSSLRQSEQLNEKQYAQMLHSADYFADAAVVSLSKVLPSITDPELREQILRYLSAVKQHRQTYATTASESKYYESSKELLEQAEILAPKYTPGELKKKKEDIQNRLNNLRQRIGEK